MPRFRVVDTDDGAEDHGAVGIVVWDRSEEGVVQAARSEVASEGSAEAVAVEVLADSADLVAGGVEEVAGARDGKVEFIMTNLHRLAALTVVLLVTPIIGGCSYNRFVTQEEAIKAQWAQVQNQLQRRNDLIPNLVETVKGYAAHEEGVFKAVADSRSKLASAATPADAIEAANAQSSALARLLAIVENYPQLKANESFNRLMDELAGTENRIAVERMRYNERVQEYNTSKRRFPSNVTAAPPGATVAEPV